MDNFKINVDREKLSSDYIKSKQNFQEVIHHVRATKPPVWKSGWFYGTIGLASIAGIIIVNTMTSNRSKNLTAESNVQQQTKAQTILAETTSASIFVHNNVAQNQSIKKEEKTPSTKKEQANAKPTKKVVTPQVSQTKTVLNEEPELSLKTTIIEVKSTPTAKNKYPKINGYFTGEIPCSVLCNSKGIEVNEDVQITSFTIQFEGKGKDQTIDVIGNKIPESVCRQISERHFDQMIFITNIFGVDELGVNHNFTPMNLIAISQE